MAFKYRIFIMDIAIRQFLGVMLDKVKIALVYIITWSSVFSLSACSTIFGMDSAIESDPIPEPPQIQMTHSAKNSQQPLNKTATSEQVNDADKKTQSEVNIGEQSKDKVRSKPVVKAAKQKVVVKRPVQKTTKEKVAVERRVAKRKVEKSKVAINKTGKQLAKKINQKTIPKVRAEKTAVNHETTMKHGLNAQSMDQDVTTSMDDLAMLPLNVGDNWVLNRGSDSAGRCALSYRELLMSDGQGDTPVSIIISQDSVVFKTRSNIDLEYEQTGLTIDDLPQIPIEKLLNDFSISYVQQYQSLIESMKLGEQAILALGFWPSWPVTQTYSLRFELSDFSSAHHALLSCIALEKELK